MSQHKIPSATKIDEKTKPGVYKVGKKIVTHTGTETRVQQSDKHLTDINYLLESAMRKGALRHSGRFKGQYDDIPYTDYQEAQYKIAKAKSMYEELPMNIRDEFNSPEKFLKFVQDPANAAKMEKMGILRGNDGLTIDGKPSGAPAPNDKTGS